MKYLFSCDRQTRARKSYEARTGMTTRAAASLAAAVVLKPETYEDEDGNICRVWQKADLMRFTASEIASCLVNRLVVTPGEMLGTVPPSAIKYCVTKGWLIPNASGSLYSITLKGAIELDLPLRFRGINGNRKIPFVNTGKGA